MGMKILLVNNFFSPEGGAELSNRHTMNLLRENGHVAEVFATSRQPYFEDTPLFESDFPAYTDYDEVKGAFGKLSKASQTFYRDDVKQSLTKVLKRFQPDVVHVNNVHYHLTPAVFAACKESNVPVVMTLRDARLFCPAGTLLKGTRIWCEDMPCVTNKGLFGSIPCVSNRCYGESLPKSALVAMEHTACKVHKLYDVVNTFICPSRALLDLAHTSGVSMERLVELPNFFSAPNQNQEPEETQALSIQHSERRWLYVGRVSAEKGIDSLLEALSKMPPPDGQEEHVGLTIVGGGPQIDELKALAQSLGVAERVQFEGYVQPEQLGAYFARAMAVILPSVWFENNPRSVLDSYIHGAPVLGANRGGIPEMIVPGETGDVFAPGDVDDLTHKMIQVQNWDEDKRAQVVKACDAFVGDRYHPQTHYRQLIDIYKSVIASSASF